MKKFTRRQGYISLDRSEVVKAIQLWLSDQDPRVYTDYDSSAPSKVQTVDSTGATVLVWTDEEEGFDEPTEERLDDGTPMVEGLIPSPETRLGDLKKRLKDFARTARLDQLSCAIIQRQLIDIANEEEHDHDRED